jgi:hypothetical protein
MTVSTAALPAPRPSTPRRHRLPVLAVAAALLSGCVVAPIGPPRHARPGYEPMPASVAARAAQPAPAQPLYFYPSRGQTEALQERDRYECYRWAVGQTGIDPGMTALRAEPTGVVRGVYLPPRANGADVIGGAATGAILGAAVSSPRNAGANAVIGAIFGAALGAAAGEARNRAIDEAEARRAEAAERAAERARAPGHNFRRAMTACMVGRGYQVE